MSRRHGGPNPERGSADDDPVQAIYERIRAEALAHGAPASWEYERVRYYGVASLCTSLAVERPFILSIQCAPRPPWSGKRDLQRERLRQAYDFLSQEVNHANGPVRARLEPETGEGEDDRIPVGGLAALC